MPLTCLFDVNETLLDLSALNPVFAEAFGGDGESARTQWFQQVLQSAFLSTLLGPYADFTALGAAALEMTAARHSLTLMLEQKQAILQGMRRLPPHPDVRPALERLQKSGARLATLTNSTAEVGRAQIEFAGLDDCFERQFSADTAQRLKPAPEPYRMAAQEMGVPLGEVWLVAAHAWDTTGAKQVGCRTAYVARPSQVWNPRAPRPDISGDDLGAVASQLLLA